VIDLQELDLADPHALPEVTERHTWILVRYGSDVLGEIRAGALDARAASRLADDLRDTYGTTIDARAVTDNVADAGVSVRADAPVSIAVVVCTRDRTALLADCLESIA
jgi:ribosomal protein S12 methylthiotransferase accessory factor YcaO